MDLKRAAAPICLISENNIPSCRGHVSARKVYHQACEREAMLRQVFIEGNTCEELIKQFAGMHIWSVANDIAMLDMQHDAQSDHLCFCG